MTTAKELLDAATPLPWAFDDNRLHPADSELPVIAGPLGMFAATTHPDDAALIVYAVNRLPDYEAAVEALERLTTEARDHEAEAGCDDYGHAVEDAFAALARLRSEVPA